MALKLKTAPALTPISVAEAKAHLRVSSTDEDALIEGLVNAAVAYLDGPSGILGRCLVSQTWELYYDAFPTGDLRIPIGNLIAVETVEYVDPDLAIFVTWSSANYEVDDKSLDGWVIPVDGWPDVLETSNAIRVTFRAGYGTAATDVPAAIRQAMLLLVGDWYTNRNAVSIGESVSELPFAVSALIAPFRFNPL